MFKPDCINRNPRFVSALLTMAYKPCVWGRYREDGSDIPKIQETIPTYPRYLSSLSLQRLLREKDEAAPHCSFWKGQGAGRRLFANPFVLTPRHLRILMAVSLYQGEHASNAHKARAVKGRGPTRIDIERISGYLHGRKLTRDLDLLVGIGLLERVREGNHREGKAWAHVRGGYQRGRVGYVLTERTRIRIKDPACPNGRPRYRFRRTYLPGNHVAYNPLSAKELKNWGSGFRSPASPSEGTQYAS